jgi:chromate transporter
VNPLLYFWLFLKASLFSTGGMGSLPSLHADLLARRWATERHFVEALAIGQVSPGPNGLWVISLGYLTNGLTGALLALVALCLPPLLVLAIERAYRRVQHHPGVEGFVRGLMLAVVGIFAVVLMGFLRSGGTDIRSIGIALGGAALALTKRVPIVVILAGAAIAGMVLY